MRAVITLILLNLVIGCIEEEKKFPVTQSEHNWIDSIRIDTPQYLTTIVLDSTGRFKRVIYGGGCTIRVVNDTGKITRAGSGGEYPYRIYYLKKKSDGAFYYSVDGDYMTRVPHKQKPVHIDGINATKFGYTPLSVLDSVTYSGTLNSTNIFGKTDSFKTISVIPFMYTNNSIVFKISKDTTGAYTVTFAKSQVKFINDSTFTFKSNK